MVALHNIGDIEQNLPTGTKIAQLIIEKIAPVQMTETTDLNQTARGDKGFGSTDTKNTETQCQSISPQNPSSVPTVEPRTSSTPTPIPFESNEIATKIATTPHDNDSIAPIVRSFSTSGANIFLSCDPFGPIATVTIQVTGVHPTLGLQLDHTITPGRLILLNCLKGTPSAKLKKWRSTLRNGNLIEINGQQISSLQQVTDMVSNARNQQKPNMQLTFATEERINVHNDSGTPQLYFDQLNAIAAYLQEIKYDEQFLDVDLETPILHLLKVKKKPKGMAQFTRKQLKQRSDWNDWVQSEHKQLQLYAMQNMFGKPLPPPKNPNIINLLWTCGIKTDGTKKARCVCNGNPRRKGTVTLAHTFAACLERPGALVFWASAYIHGMIVIGADASNAFAEAPPPKAPLYVVVDQQYRKWWVSQGNSDIPIGWVMPVQHALQGHLESPRLWAIMIDQIIRNEVNLQPTTHEPCLYSGYVDGHKVLFLRQVDDFAVACTDIDTSNKVIDLISNKLSAPMHKLGVINRYNGIDVMQTQDYIKIHNATYLTKILKNHAWLQDVQKTHVNPIPMKEGTKYQQLLDTVKPPETEQEKSDLEMEMGFSYRVAIGEAIFAMVTCRPDIAFSVIKLSKFCNAPAKEHYLAVKNLFRYLHATKDDGILYWRKTPSQHKSLVISPTPTTFHQKVDKPGNDSNNLIGSVDSDWANDFNERRLFYLAGGAVHYKTRILEDVAHSSTEAEFVAANEAGKMAKYLRTILQQIGSPQENATIIFIENTGALMMANARQPTRRTRHMDIKHFGIQDWVEQDLVILEDIRSPQNSADSFTKALVRTLYYVHNDVIMGRIPPSYYEGKIVPTYSTPKNMHS